MEIKQLIATAEQAMEDMWKLSQGKLLEHEQTAYNCLRLFCKKMTEAQILNLENLIELHEILNEFATHHQNKGGQEAHRLINEEWRRIKSFPRDGSPGGISYNEGYDQAVADMLMVVRQRFIP